MRIRYIWPAVILIAAACNGDADPTPPPAAATEAPAAATDAPATDAPAGETAATAGLPEECVLPPYDIEIRRDGTGENETMTVLGARDTGFGVGPGQWLAYKIFLADYELAEDEDLITQIMPDNMPAGATVVNVDLGRAYDSDDDTPANEYPNIEAGEELTHFRFSSGPDATLGTQTTITNPDGVTASSVADSEASGTILYADDEFVCLDVDIRSQAGYQVKGIITATVG